MSKLDEIISVELEWVNEVFNNMDDYEDGTFDDALRDLGISYLKLQGKSDKEIDNMSDQDIVSAGNNYFESTLQ